MGPRDEQPTHGAIMLELGQVKGELAGVKEALKLLTDTQSTSHLALQSRLHSVEMRVFIGLGMALLAGFLVPLMFRHNPNSGPVQSRSSSDEAQLCATSPWNAWMRSP